jgi:peptidoglycan/xylan/chitin deacetylase (PgdA/CDA1 family)
MRHSLVAGLLASALLVSAAASTAFARNVWPQPAAGASASGDPEVVFTFDDGPDEDATAEILDTLKQYNVKALFFWTGWRVIGEQPLKSRRRAAARRAVLEGHMVGNHTVNHAHLCSVPAADAEVEIDDAARVLGALTGLPMHLIRVPYGDRCKRLEKMLEVRGLQHLHWDMDPLEWEPTASSSSTRDYLIDKIRNLKGRGVVLLHDTKLGTARALPQVLEWILQENQRRATTGERPIRILSYADLVLEQIPAPIQDLVDHFATAATSFVPHVAARLLLPLAPAPPPPRHASNP